VRRSARRVCGVGLFSYRLSDQSIKVREHADAVMRKLVERKRLGRFLRLTETPGVYASHPLGGCRMANGPDFGVTDHSCQVFGYEGLFCMDSSAIPTSLGVNPSLTISAVCERAAAILVRRGEALGLPRRPKKFKHRPPGVHVGPRRHP
jgi:choline dehydrogenase-like flavoprotein